jgi:hypothetical protein
MSKFIPIGRISADGCAAVRELLTTSLVVSDPKERLEAAHAIIMNPAYVEAIPGLGDIDLDIRFDSAWDFAAYVHPRIVSAGDSVFLDTGVNIFLLLAYIDQLVPASARKVDHYFVDERGQNGNGAKRNYRNALYVHLTLYHMHHHNDVCRILLSGHPSEITMAEDRIAQRPAVKAATGAIEAIVGMFFDPRTGKRRRTPAKAKGSSIPNKNVNDALKELSVIVFSQCARNYDIARMSGLQILAMVPDTPGLKPYKKHAKAWLTSREADKEDNS